MREISPERHWYAVQSNQLIYDDQHIFKFINYRTYTNCKINDNVISFRKKLITTVQNNEFSLKNFSLD